MERRRKKEKIYDGIIARDKTGVDHIGANYLEVGQGSVQINISRSKHPSADRWKRLSPKGNERREDVG